MQTQLFFSKETANLIRRTMQHLLLSILGAYSSLKLKESKFFLVPSWLAVPAVIVVLKKNHLSQFGIWWGAEKRKHLCLCRLSFNQEWDE